MKIRKLLVISLIVIVVAQIASKILVHGNTPIPIGATVQSVPFESNPTFNIVTILTVTNPANAYDGSLDNYALFRYTGVDGSFELQNFNTTGTQFSTIGWVDFKISYKATASVDDEYRIVYYVAGSGPVVLQDWVGGSSAQFPSILAPFKQAHRAFSIKPEPTDGVWTWTDIANVRVMFETRVVGTPDATKYVNVYEVWLSVYPGPLPPDGVSVKPSTIVGLHAGTAFFVDLYAVGVTKLWSFEFKLTYDTSILTALDIAMGHEYFGYNPLNDLFAGEINETAGYVSLVFTSYFGDPVGFTGNTPMARIYFTVDADGTSQLHFSKSILANTEGNEIKKPVSDGVFATTPTRNLAVTDIKVSPTQVMPGEIVDVNVTVMNQGTIPETFDVTVYYDSTPIGPNQTITLDSAATQTLTFEWDTTGVTENHYMIKAKASEVPNETNTADNTLTWTRPPGILIVGRHDISITNVTRAYPTPSATFASNVMLTVSQGQTVYINATVSNSGNFTETFNLTARYYYHSGPRTGEKLIKTVTGLSLDAGASTMRTFAWNTIDAPFGSSFSPKGMLVWQNVSECTIKANVTKVPYEKGFDYDYTSDNEYVDGFVNVNRSAPMSKFEISPNEAFIGQPVKFDAQNSRTATGTSIILYRWYFGDGNITEATNPIMYHAYASKGSFKPNLTVWNDVGFNDTSTYTYDLKTYVRDVALVGVTPNATSAAIGESLNITVTVLNKGEKDETTLFKVTVYYDDTPIATKSTTNYLSQYGITGDNETIVFTWNTINASLGSHIIKAVAEALPWEVSSDNNWLTADASVTLLWHNIHLTSVKASKPEVTVGESVVISVKVENQGNFTETFTITVYYNMTEIQTKPVTNLAGVTSATVDFAWATSGLSLGAYTLRAVASNVSGEISTSDNRIIGDTVTLKGASDTGIILYAAVGIVIAVAVGIGLFYFFKVRKHGPK